MAKFSGETVLWKPLYIASAALLMLTISIVPLNSVATTIILFTLVSLWTRVLGMILPVARDLEMTSFFTLIIAVNFGGIPAVLFGVFNLWLAKFFSPSGNTHCTVKDSIAFLVSGLLLPMIFISTGSLLITMYAFILLRYAVRLVISVGLDADCMSEELGAIAIGIPISLLMNTIYVDAFGNFAIKLASQGLSFSLELLGFAVAVVAIIAVTVYVRQFAGRFKRNNGEEFGHLIVEK